MLTQLKTVETVAQHHIRTPPQQFALGHTFMETACAAMSFATGPPGRIATNRHLAHSGKLSSALQSPPTSSSSSGRRAKNGTNAFLVAMLWSPIAFIIYKQIACGKKGFC